MSANINSNLLSGVSNINNVDTQGFLNKIMPFLKNNSTIQTIIYIVIIVLSIIILINLIIKSYNIYVDIKQKNPWLLYGTKDATKHQYVIQDIETNPLQLIKPSTNRAGGLEFSYGCWIYIDNYDYRKGLWKNILHKGSSDIIDCPGSSTARSSQCPGLWLGEHDNTLHVFINTFIQNSASGDNTWSEASTDELPNTLGSLTNSNACNIRDQAALLCNSGTTTTQPSATTIPSTTSTGTPSTATSSQTQNPHNCPPPNDDNNIVESVSIDNIPINNWVNIVVAVRQHNLDVYINGILAKRKLLQYLPKQNSGDLHINANGGFNGYVSNIRYFSYYITEGELFKFVRTGPSSLPPANTIAKPPYLTERWWLRQ